MKTKVKVTYEATVKVRWSQTVVVTVDDPDEMENDFQIARRVYDEAKRRSSRCGTPGLPKQGRKIGAWTVDESYTPKWVEMEEVE